MNTHLYHYRITNLDIYDGDTVRADIDLGLDVVLKRQKIRLFGIDTPEIRGEEREEGLKAKEYLEILLFNRELIIQTHKDKKGKYGRYLGTIWYLSEGGEWQNANEGLIKAGHAKRYGQT